MAKIKDIVLDIRTHFNTIGSTGFQGLAYIGGGGDNLLCNLLGGRLTVVKCHGGGEVSKNGQNVVT